MIQFINTLHQITSCDSVGPVRGVTAHLSWQLRRLFGLFPCELPIGKSRLYVDRPGGVAALVNAMGEYDYNNMQLLKLLLAQKPAAFIDVGANIGSYTLVASQVPGTMVVSIEPHPVTFASLEESIRLNGRHNVTCLNVAVSRDDSELRLSDGPESSVNRVLAAGETTDRELHVSSRRLQTLCRELNIIPDFIKMDVEGHERAVLDGLGEFKIAPNMIFIEGGERPEIQEWMREADYVGPCFVHYNARIVSRSYQRRAEDPIFIRKNYFSELQRLGFNSVGETVQS